MSRRFLITEIEYESFPCECTPALVETDLPCYVLLDDVDQCRTDAAQYGILAHSPYCPDCAKQRAHSHKQNEVTQ